MFYFKRFISYMDYYENGVKVKNAGHAKVIVEDKKCTLEIHIKDLQKNDSLTVPVKTLQGITIGKMELKQGIGRYAAVYLASDMDGLGTSIDMINGLKIPVAEGRFCSAVWKKDVSDIETEAEKSELLTQEAEENKEDVIEETVAKTKEEDMKGKREIKEALYSDKWQQLCHVYKSVHPFGDEDEFISIEPKDFIIMQQEYQHLVNNSFLLHGFYNYRHIILGKKSNSKQYYIGVPGTYYEREKMVAVMFGFEGFEASGESIENVKIEQGTYGYYMRKVEL